MQVAYYLRINCSEVGQCLLNGKEDGTNNGKLTFEIAPEKIKEGLDIAFNRVKKNLNVPGFRKGRVPRQIFNRMYGEEALYQDALNALLPNAYADAVQEAGIKPVAQPEVNIESMEKDAAWVLSAKVTVEPEVELGQYKNLKLPRTQPVFLKQMLKPN